MQKIKWIGSNNIWIFDNSHNDYLLSLVTISQIKSSSLATTFFLLKVIKREPWTNRELFKQASSGKCKEKEVKKKQKNQKENHNRWRQTRKDKFPYSEVRTKRYADVLSLSFLGDRYVRALKALAV